MLFWTGTEKLLGYTRLIMQTAASDDRLNTKLTTDILSLKGRWEGSHYYVGSLLIIMNHPFFV